jgi:hypothetical protein
MSSLASLTLLDSDVDKIPSHPIKKLKSNKHEAFHCAHPRQSSWNLGCNCLFSCFPDELMIVAIFTYLNTLELCNCVAVCRRWKFLSTDKLLWHKLSLAQYANFATDGTFAFLSRSFGSAVYDLELCECKKLSKPLLLQFSASMKNLESLHLCQLKAVDDLVVGTIAQQCKKLESLSLFGCTTVTDDGIKVLGSLRPNLRQLSLGNCSRISNDALSNLGSEALRDLNLRSCRRITDEGLLALTKRSPNLEKLNLHGVTVTDEILHTLVTHCQYLSALNLASANPFGGGLLTDSGLATLSSLGHTLSSLNLQGSSRITDEGMIQLTRKCTKLEKLNLGGCMRLGNKTAAALSHFCSRLTHLSLFQCSSLTDVGVTLILSSLKKLQLLDLHSCMGLTDVSLSLFTTPERVPSLKFLDLGSCRGVTEDRVNQVKSERPGLKITYY